MAGLLSRLNCFKARPGGSDGGGAASSSAGGGHGPVSVTYTVDGAEVTETFDYLVVACDPRGLAIDDRTAFERAVKDALKSFTFHTSLYKAARPDHAQLDIDDPGKPRTMAPNYAVRFHPGVLEAMDGRPYGFRDEVFAHDAGLKPDRTGKTWCTTYQLEKAPLLGREPGAVREELGRLRDAAVADNGAGNMWFDWTPDESERPQPEEDVLVDYFAHFDAKELHEGLPWAIRDHQGEKNTFYVASFTCFESVLHCYLYEERLMDPNGRLVQNGVFPADRRKSFAVVGAGPSGLLFATQHLLKKGYHNFKIFESSERFGGKTFTYRREAPGDKSVVPCELGTCYLSPAYEPMWWLFKEYGAGEVVALDKGSNRFRAIIDNDIATTQQEKEDGVEYSAWTVRKNGPSFKVSFICYLLLGQCSWSSANRGTPQSPRVI